MLEPWILHDYPEDFYGAELRLAIIGKLRGEMKFEDFGDLIKAIREDGDWCQEELKKHESVTSEDFFILRE